jgi:hypothetical protein
VTFSIEQALAEFFDNSGGGGVAYGGTGQTGTITGNPTGGSGTGSSYSPTGVAETGPNGSQVLYGVTYSDESGEQVYIDISIYGPSFTSQNQNYEGLSHTLEDMAVDIHSFTTMNTHTVVSITVITEYCTMQDCISNLSTSCSRETALSLVTRQGPPLQRSLPTLAWMETIISSAEMWRTAAQATTRL